MKGRADRGRGGEGGVAGVIVSLIKPWEAQGGRQMRGEVSELNVRSGREVADLHEVYTHILYSTGTRIHYSTHTQVVKLSPLTSLLLLTH